VASSADRRIRGFVELVDEEPHSAHGNDAGSQRLQECLGSLPRHRCARVHDRHEHREDDPGGNPLPFLELHARLVTGTAYS